MMFLERLETIIEVLGIRSSSELARHMGCDRTYISKVRHGRNIILPESRAGNKLIGALCSIAETNGRVTELMQLIGARESGELYRKMSDWLFEGMEPEPKIKRRRRSRRQGNAVQFGKKINSVIELADISNIRLAQLSNVDASVISRYRRGQRAANVNSGILESVCRELVTRIYSKGLEGELLSMTGIEETSDIEEVCARLISWLCDYGVNESAAISGLLSDINALKPTAELPELPIDDIAVDESKSAYIGDEGIKQSVIRFLVNVIRSGAREMHLYSDRSMDWLSDDPGYARQWFQLMGECVRRGVRIRIIHNIDREIDEMTDAIRKWLPLYMSGMIESYYSTASRGSRFSHTIFLAPGTACISSCSPRGAEKSAVYRYVTEAEELESGEIMYNELLANCRPLVRISAGTAEDTGRRFLIDGREAENVRVVMNDNEVTIRHITQPLLDFHIAHPLMKNTFEVYLGSY